MKTKTLFFAIIILFSVIFDLRSQSIDWIWAKSVNGNGSDFVQDLKVDLQGNCFVTGYFYSQSLIFGNDTLENINVATNNIFISKYDANGNILWAKSSGGSGFDVGTSIAVDVSGNCYVTGFFTSPFIILGNDTLFNYGLSQSMFVAKLDVGGNVVWTYTTAGWARSNGMAVDNFGNCFVAGLFDTTAINFDGYVLTNSGGFNTFLVKFDSVGNIMWAKAPSISNDNYANDIAVDDFGNVFIAGSFAGASIAFDSIVLVNTQAVTSNAFVVRYNEVGNAIWARSFGGQQNDNGSGIAISKSGNVYMSGSFQSFFINLGTVTFNINGDNDLFLVKIDAKGNVKWGTTAGGIYSDNCRGITIDANESVYLTGNFTSSSMNFQNNVIYNSGYNDVFLSKFSKNGNLIWASAVGGIYSDGGIGIDVDASGNGYLAGFYDSPSFTLGNFILPGNGFTGDDIFVAKFGTTSGYEELQNFSFLFVEPNPMSEYASILITEYQKNSTFVLTDVLGVDVQKFMFSGNNLVLFRNFLKPGIYFIRITNSDKIIANGKLIIH